MLHCQSNLILLVKAVTKTAWIQEDVEINSILDTVVENYSANAHVGWEILLNPSWENTICHTQKCR